MASNQILHKAKKTKNDEYYTQYADIESEISAYVSHNPFLFQNKTILCPCDDPEWSKFTRFFLDNFDNFGLKRLISTCIAREPDPQLSLFTQTDPDQTRGKILVADSKTTSPDSWSYLDGNGDFRGKEITGLREQSDFIITNPPFSKARDFTKWVLGKQFAFIGNKNMITGKDVFPLIKDGKIWLGYRSMNKNFWMIVPEDSDYDREENGMKLKMIMSCWLTNIDHERKEKRNPIRLKTSEENLKKKKMIRKCEKEGWIDINGQPIYPTLDNYRGVIEVPYVDCIPSDYMGIMAVPITFLDVYDKNEYEILNANDYRAEGDATKTNILLPETRRVYGSYEDMVARPVINGKRKYRRIFVRKKMSDRI